MKIFIDSGILEEVREIESYGILNGVTTNPSLMKKAVEKLKKEGKEVDMEDYIKEIILAANRKPVSLEVISTDYEGMVREGRLLYKKFNHHSGNIVIKIPISSAFGKEVNTFDALRAIKTLREKEIAVNCTLVFTPEQALLAAKAGATYISPFVGRIDDYLRTKSKIKFEKSDYFPAGGFEKKGKLLDDNGIVSGVDLISQISKVLKNNGFESKIIASSIRNPRQVRECALAGADIATIPFNTIKEMIKHPKTKEGMEKFTKDIVLEYSNLLKE
jgi:transaldolase